MASDLLETSPGQIIEKVQNLLEEQYADHKQISLLRQKLASVEFMERLGSTETIQGVTLLTATLEDTDADTMRQMVDQFRKRFPQNSVVVLATVQDGRPSLIAALSDDLVPRGLHAGELVKFVAQPLGGSGGGRPTMAQAGGKDASQLEQALAAVPNWVVEHLH